MSTRQNIVDWTSSQIGTVEAKGYDGPNPYSTRLGFPTEAWCGDFATCAFLECALPLPSMQVGCSTGFAGVPAGLDFADMRGTTGPSWEAQPGDLACFDWNGDGSPDHVEVVIEWDGGVLYSAGGNSGTLDLRAGSRNPLNGGVNEHVWSAPAGTGNRVVLAIIRTGLLVPFRTTAPPSPPQRELMLKSPNMTGLDVADVQGKLNNSNLRIHLVVDGDYGPLTTAAVQVWQRAHRLTADGICGPQTYAAGL
jgi:hypothetical protein